MKKKQISPLNDAVFTNVFGDQRNIGNTREFLKTLLDIPEDEYDKLTVKNTVLKPVYQWGKTGIVDVLLTTKSGKNIHIELQVEKSTNLRNRIMFYAAQLIDRQLKRGSRYEKMHQVISIVICNHILLEEEDMYINEYELRNVKTNRRFTDLLKVITLELPKIPEAEDQPVWPWLRFFKCTTAEDFMMLVKKHPKLKKAVECTHRASFSERLDATLFLLDKQRRDLRAWKDEVREEAKADAKKIVDEYAQAQAQGLTDAKAQELAQAKAQELAQTKAKELAQGVLHELAQAKAKELAQGLAKELVQDLAKELTQDLAKEYAKNLAKDLEKEHAKDLAKKYAKDLAEDLVKAKMIDIAKNLKVRGRPVQEIIEDTGLSPEIVEQL